MSEPHNSSIPQLEISPQEVSSLLHASADFLFIDCRKPEEREQSRIDGTTLIPMHDLDLHIDWLRQRADQHMIVHCRSGRRSMSMTLLLRELGFPNVQSMAGGIERWDREIGATIKSVQG